MCVTAVALFYSSVSVSVKAALCRDRGYERLGKRIEPTVQK